eukprot:gene5250-7296_t
MDAMSDLPGRKLWVLSKQYGWVLANIVKVDNDNETIVYGYDDHHNDEKSSTYVISVKFTHPVDATHFNDDLDDICLMNKIHEAPILNIIRKRYETNMIYTYVGDVLISINPYQDLSNTYDVEILMQYLFLEKKKPNKNVYDTSSILPRNSQPKPHIYKLANRALSQSFNNNDSSNILNQVINQSIIVSGESGSGKTEAVKHVINFLIEADEILMNQMKSSHNISLNNISSFNSSSEIRSYILNSNVIFESFGNAKTIHNDNSSRFGKYTKIMYCNYDSVNSNDVSNKIEGGKVIHSAFTETFLLEKSRLVSIGQNERNFNAFYQLFYGLPVINPILFQKLQLNSKLESFRILNCNNVQLQALPRANNNSKNTVNFQASINRDIQNFHYTYNALKVIKCSEEEIEHIWTLLACCLHLGNVYPRLDHEDGSSPPSVELESPSIAFGDLASFLGVTFERFATCLLMQQLVVAGGRSSTKVKVLTELEVKNNIQALLKWIYNRLFSWLVLKVNIVYFQNHTISNQYSEDEVQDNHKITSTKYNDIPSGSSKLLPFIGILDIFGFEVLAINSFEQLCINYTNEILFQQFYENIFLDEQERYKNENLNWSNIYSNQDNKNVIELIAKKPLGLLCILEEHGMLNRGKPDDLALISSYNQAHDRTNHANNDSSNADSKGKTFVVRHFAGEVVYSMDGFLLKNNDALQEDLLDLMRSSDNIFLRNALKIGDPDTNGPGYINEKVLNFHKNDSKNENKPLPPPPPPSQDFNRVKMLQASSSAKKMAASVTVSFNFRNQLDALMGELRSTHPHYVCCIKPNSTKSTGEIDASLVLQQLRYNGLYEVIRIRKEGFPTRMSFIDFYTDYEVLARQRPFASFASSKLCSEAQSKEYTILLASSTFPPDFYQIGVKNIFLKDGYDTYIESATLKIFSKYALKIQERFKFLRVKKKLKLEYDSFNMEEKIPTKAIPKSNKRNNNNSIIDEVSFNE